MESRKSGLPKALQDSAPAGIFNLGSSANAETANVSQQNRVQLMYKNAMAFAKSPMSSIFMTAFMMYMTGNSLQIFSIVMLAMAFWNPTQAIINVEKSFKKYEHPKISLMMPKMIFIGLQLANLGVVIYKCQNLGLLPKTLDFTIQKASVLPYMNDYSAIIVE